MFDQNKINFEVEKFPLVNQWTEELGYHKEDTIIIRLGLVCLGKQSTISDGAALLGNVEHLNLIKEVLSEDRFDEDNKYEENLEFYFKNYLKKYFKDFDENLSINNLHNNFISKIEKPLIETTLNLFRGNQIKASKCLGFNRNTLRSKINLYGIEVVKKR